MGKKSLEQIVREHKELGFDEAVIEIAYANVNGNEERIIEQIFRLQQQSSAYPTKPANPQDEDAQLSKAIAISMDQAKQKKISLEPLNPEQRVRKSGVPVGLKNIGNTCYFNSLLQTYFQNAAFVRAILSYEVPARYRGVKDEEIQKRVQEDFDFKRKMVSCRLVENLKQLFCGLIASDRRYLDPTLVLSSIVDDYGNQIAVGDQKDIGEFNLIFLSRVEDGLEEARRDRKMESEVVGQESEAKMNVFGQESLLRHSSMRIREQSVIASEFIGKIENCFINEKEGIGKAEEELFSLLFLNVKNKQLYKACEEVTISHIEDYRNEKGEVIGVDKHTWIKEAPRTLFFQIDRVVYDKVTLTPQKINDPFDFPTVFYVDPFLLKNKDRALEIQKAVRGLRKERQQYVKALSTIQQYGEKQYSLIDILGEASKFLHEQGQQMEVEQQIDNPIFVPSLAAQIRPNLPQLLLDYRTTLQQRVSSYKSKIEAIDREITKSYSAINSTPYYLYSLLIHEGGADSGHYYSYTYDHQQSRWRKYNDMNITEETEPEVLKFARGSNMTSAYYIVYAQREVLLPAGVTGEKLNFRLSSEEGYMHDYYGSFLSPEQRASVQTDNHQMYNEIEQHKMGSLASRVVDVYAKKFQSYNEIFRKTKIEKKKNTPPLLTSLPVYVKAADEQEYKALLIEQAVREYGPKQSSVVFEELLKKKLSSFHDFKRPKRYQCNEKYQNAFVKSVYWAITTRRLFEAIDQEQYASIFVLLRELLDSDREDYFNWLARIMLKVFVVRLLFEAERDVQEKLGVAVEKMQMATIILLKYLNPEEEKMLWINTIVWINDIKEGAGEETSKIGELLGLIDEKQYHEQYRGLEERNQDEFKEIVAGVELSDALWNPSRQENTVVNAMLEARERVKGKFENCNKLYIEMKKYNYPLKKEERDKFLL